MYLYYCTQMTIFLTIQIKKAHGSLETDLFQTQTNHPIDVSFGQTNIYGMMVDQPMRVRYYHQSGGIYFEQNHSSRHLVIRQYLKRDLCVTLDSRHFPELQGYTGSYTNAGAPYRRVSGGRVFCQH